MNREEAIERFENVKANALVQKASGVSEYWQNEIDGTVEAIDMAIEALSVANLKEEFESAEYEDYEHATLVDIKEPLKVLVVRCKDCLYKQLMDEGDTKYYYCALEDRPNRNWSVDDMDYCSWGERSEE